MTTENIEVVFTERGAKQVQAAIQGIADTASSAGSKMEGSTNGINSFGNAAQSAAPKLESVKAAMDKLGVGADLLVKSMGALAAAFSIDHILDVSDKYTLMENKLKSVTKNADDLAQVQQKLMQVARDTNTPFEDAVDTFQKLTNATKEMHLSQKDVIEVMTTMNRIVAASGVSAQDAKNGLVQLNQGLISGKLNGENLKSALEDIPMLGQYIAKGMSVPIGTLRELGEKGKLTADDFIKAMQKVKTDVDKLDLKTTIGQGFQYLKDKVDESINSFLKWTGALNGAGDALKKLGDAIPTIFTALGPLAGGAAIFYGLNAGATLFKTTLSGIVSLLFMGKKPDWADPSRWNFASTVGGLNRYSKKEVVDTVRGPGEFTKAQKGIMGAKGVDGLVAADAVKLSNYEQALYRVAQAQNVATVASTGLMGQLRALGVWMASNPFLLIVGTLAVIVSYIETFGDKVQVTVGGKTTTVLKVFNAALGAVWDSIKEGIAAVISGFTGINGSVNDVLKAGLGAAFQFIIDHATELKYIVMGLAVVIAAPFVAAYKAGQILGRVIAGVIISFIKVGGVIGEVVAKIINGFGVLALSAFEKWTGMWVAIGGLGESFLSSMKALWDGITSDAQTFWQMLVQLATNSWDGIVAIWNAAGAYFVQTWEEIKTASSDAWDVIKNAATGVWTSIQNAASSAWQFIQGMWQGAGSFFTTLWNTISDGASTAWNYVISNGQNAWTVIQAAWSGTVQWFTDLWTKITEPVQKFIDWLTKGFTDIVEKLKKLWNDFSEKLTDIWNKAKDTYQAFFDYMDKTFSPWIETVKKFGTAWDDVISRIKTALGLKAQYENGGSGGNNSGNSGAVHAATGGLVTGPGTAKSDSIPAQLSNGEFVVNADATRRFLPILSMLNGGANTSNRTNHYADGGFVTLGGGSNAAAAIQQGTEAGMKPAVSVLSEGMGGITDSTRQTTEAVGNVIGGQHTQTTSIGGFIGQTTSATRAVGGYINDGTQVEKINGVTLNRVDSGTSQNGSRIDTTNSTLSQMMSNASKYAEQQAADNQKMYDSMQQAYNVVNSQQYDQLGWSGGLYKNDGSNTDRWRDYGSQSGFSTDSNFNFGGFTDVNGNPSNASHQFDYFRPADLERDFAADGKVLKNPFASGLWKRFYDLSIMRMSAGPNGVQGWGEAVRKFRDYRNMATQADIEWIQRFAPGWWSAVTKYNSGGSFVVDGEGGIDNNLVAMRLSKGERVDITPASRAREGQAGGSKAGVNVTFNISTPDADSFRKSQPQIARKFVETINRSLDNM